MSSIEPKPLGDRQRRTRAVLAAVITALLAILPAVTLAPTASAAAAGITAHLLRNGSPLTPGTVVSEGDTISLKVQYDTRVVPGSAHTFQLGGAVTLQGVPAGNAAIASIVRDASNPDLVTVTFADPWPADVNQGVFELAYTVNGVVTTGPVPITWTIDGEPETVDVVVRKPGDQPENVSDAWEKRVSPGNRNDRVSVGIDPVTGLYELQIDPALQSDRFAYTLRVDSADAAARVGYPIADALPAGYRYVTGSFEYRTTTWDASGWNMTTTAWAAWSPSVSADGDSFTGALDLPAKSITEIRYTTEVDDWALVQARIRDAFDSRTGAPGPGWFGTAWTNTAAFGPASAVTRTATFEINGNAPGPVPGSAFVKWSDWPGAGDPAGERTVDAAPDGTLTPALDIRYSLKADLGQWDGRNTYYTLDRNVVIEDVLPTQLVWNTGAADVVRLDAGSTLFDGTWDAPGSAVTSLTELTCPATRADFGATAVGSWCIDGQRLWVNAGRDPQTNAIVDVRALLTTTAGLDDMGNSPIAGGERLRVRNHADFFHREGARERATRDDFLVVRPQDQSGGVNDSRAFSKSSAVSGEIVVEPGQTADVPYRFTVRTGITGTPAAQSRIVDHVDTSVFDISDPTSIPVSGDYAGTPLVQSDFTVSREGDELVIQLSSAGAAKTATPDGVLVVDLVLTTRPFVGKETMSITNRASLFGLGDAPTHWSADEASATSYGNEAEVSKHVYDRADAEWTGRLRAQLGADGTLVDDLYVYRIGFIPHGSYGGVAISPVIDELPGAVEFLGFVGEGDVVDPEPALQPGPVALGGNLVATHDAGAGRVIISQQPGTLYTGGTRATYFAVRVINVSGPIVNQISGTPIRATIEPVGPHPDPSGPLASTGLGHAADAAVAAALALGLGIVVMLVAVIRRRRV